MGVRVCYITLRVLQRCTPTAAYPILNILYSTCYINTHISDTPWLVALRLPKRFSVRDLSPDTGGRSLSVRRSERIYDSYTTQEVELKNDQIEGSIL